MMPDKFPPGRKPRCSFCQRTNNQAGGPYEVRKRLRRTKSARGKLLYRFCAACYGSLERTLDRALKQRGRLS